MKSRKKGFTVVEIVIALAVISIISLAATSLVLSSQNVQKKSRDKFFAVTLCNNSISIFQSAAKESDNIPDLCDAFADKINILGIEFDKSQTTPQTIYFDGGWTPTNAEGAKFECELSFKYGESANTVIFEINIKNISGDKIYSTSYLMAFGGQQ